MSFMLLLMAASSCVSSKKVQRDGLILDRNKIKTDNKDLNIEELEGFIHQKPNGKALGFIRLNTFFYERFKPKWIRETLGKKPVIYDSMQVVNSMRDMKSYLAAKGYFHAELDKDVKKKKKAAKVTYFIYSGSPYTLRNVSYSIHDSQLEGFINSDLENSLVKSGSNFDTYTLDDERYRLTTYLRNQGYYFFNRDYISYKVDSNFQSRQMDIVIEFKQPTERDNETGQIIEKKHLRYRMNDITINTDYKIMVDEYIPYDTLVVPQWIKFPERPYKYYFLYHNKLRITPPTIDRFIFLRGGRYYSVDNANLTYNRLSNLAITRFVNVNLVPAQEFPDEGYGYLDGYIDIGRNPVQVYSIEAEGTNTGGSLGIGSNFVYTNRNLLRGGEVFTIKLKGGLEMQRSFGESTPFFLGFNTVETGIEARLTLPKLFLPGRQQKYTRHAAPSTTFTTGLNFQLRPDYTRYILNFSFGYEWRETVTKSHVFIPAELNSVRIFRSAEFSDWLYGLKDPRLIYQYTNHLVPLTRYIFTFNNQPLRKNRDFMFFRGNAESSGNLLYLADNLLEQPTTDEGYYTKLGIRYAQFVRGEVDYRYYKFVNPKSNLVFRIAGGVGVPYGNSEVLPVEKGFYAGGANGIRGWEIRALGPGSFSDPENEFDKMGEVWMESNLEYRFPMYSFLNGAVYVDAGNIWLLSENLDFPGGEFDAATFSDQIAISTGFGFRVDLSFFIFRVDTGIKLKNPSKEINDRWVDMTQFRLRDVVWNFGIGYPF
ncbi:MAG: BamA/TamA family outer membrane protein [Bacteroidales bacterium]|nr:BamA/TamA family outer membrane protein [Bacteroidales bacterium]